ncbi:MAG: HD domain-containing phosphohydrolase [Alkalispirochaeta sp.]
MVGVNNARVMVVDDAPTNLKLLELLLTAETYRVETYLRGTAALEAAMNDPPDIILLDVSMPEMDGYEVCRRLKEDDRLRETPVLFISAHSETADKVKGFEAGGVDYITKPFHVAEVRVRVGTHLKLARLQQILQQQNADLEKRVEEKVAEVYSAQLSTITALAKLAEHRDNDTGQHLERVQRYTHLLAVQLQKARVYADEIDDRFIHNLYHATPLHDIGKVSIPDRILLKPGRLEPEEFEVMKTHTTVGANTLAEVYADYQYNEFLSLGVAITRSHHERWDGKGYPDGLAGPAIPLAARIMAIADVYDALRSKRVYKESKPHDETLTIICDGAGTQFDPAIVDAFHSIEDEFRQIVETMR